MKNWKTLKKELLENKKVALEYDRLKPRYSLIAQLIEKRLKKGLSQKQLAERIGTKQSAIARLETGDYNPTVDFLVKISQALNSKLIIHFK